MATEVPSPAPRSVARGHEAAFVDALRKRRIALGLSQEEVAQLMLLQTFTWTRSTVASVETGRRSLRVDEYVALTGLMAREMPALARERIRSIAAELEEAIRDCT